jgi:hypothetical protein
MPVDAEADAGREASMTIERGIELDVEREGYTS